LATDRVFLTGATGFVGAHIARALVARGYAVRALVRDARTRVEGCETVAGDLTRSGELVPALEGCRYVVHCAALYSFTPRDRKSIHAVNVTGTAGLLDAAYLAGVERAVVTSSSATLGEVRATRKDDYHSSKLLQEYAAFEARVPVVAVLPTAPVGPGDWKPTPTGKMIVDFARGAMFAKPPGHGGMNLVAVEDVAAVHVAALERGRPGERYVAGGENMSFDELWELLAELTGRKVPSFRAPFALALAVAYVDEARCRLVPGARPFAPLEGVHLSTHRMFADSSKTIAELGYRPQPVRGALERALDWYRSHGYYS
jgi:dihydroflavonol-4-reductase